MGCHHRSLDNLVLYGSEPGLSNIDAELEKLAMSRGGLNSVPGHSHRFYCAAVFS
jgi:hypothetical protein